MIDAPIIVRITNDINDAMAGIEQAKEVVCSLLTCKGEGVPETCETAYTELGGAVESLTEAMAKLAKEIEA